MFPYYEARYKCVTGCDTPAVLLPCLYRNIVQNGANKNKKYRISENKNSGNVECKVMCVIIYGATTTLKEEFSERNSTDVLE
jgi:hypothetical protein